MVNGQNSTLNDLASLKDAAPKAQAYSTVMDQLLPDQYGIVNFGSWLSTIALKYGVTVSSAFSNGGVPSLQSTASTPGSIDFSLTINGTATNTTQFLNDAESHSSGFLFTLNSFDYTNDPSGAKISAQGTLFFR